jgi:hypothetical protein
LAEIIIIVAISSMSGSGRSQNKKIPNVNIGRNCGIQNFLCEKEIKIIVNMKADIPIIFEEKMLTPKNLNARLIRSDVSGPYITLL